LPIIPNAAKAIISPGKLLNYLFSFKHPIGKSKAKFFSKFGYNESTIECFIADERKTIQTQDVLTATSTEYGTKYVITGPMKSPSGVTIEVCTVWVILKGEDTPRFVTAYAGGRK
jgi:hypothetical protein